MPLNCDILVFAARAITPIKTKKNIMSSVTGAKGRAKPATTSKPKAKAASSVVKALTKDQLHALCQVTEGSIVKNGMTTIKKDQKEYEVECYDLTISITKTINANSLAKAAENAVAVTEVVAATYGNDKKILEELQKISDKVSSEAEKGTITKALRVLNGIVQPAQAATLKI